MIRMTIYNSWEKDIIEKAHISLCKQVLGVNKQCPNVACRNELGRLPLKELTDLNILKFWIHLENQPEDSIARQCLTIWKELANKNQVCFAQKVNKLCETSNLNTANLAKNDPSSFLSQIRSSLSKKISEHQLNLIKCNKKLTFYSQFRTDCHKADFLNTINNPIHKKSLNKFRLGNHQLMIETGRHTIPKTPENLRICPFCQLNEVEHELHFILSCPFYNNLSSKFFWRYEEEIYQF